MSRARYEEIIERWTEYGLFDITDAARQEERIIRHPTACDTAECEERVEPGETTCAPCKQSQAEFEQFLSDCEAEREGHGN